MMSSRSLAEDIREEMTGLSLDAETKVAVEKWLQADKEFNVWFLVTTKRQLGDDDLMGLLDGYRETQESAESAWRAFRKDKLDQAGFRQGLDDSLAKMNELMKRG
jgi:hypothetical protein